MATMGAHTHVALHDDDHHQQPRVVDLEEALEMYGDGRFQWLMLLVCGLANAADAVEIMSIGLVLPVADADLQLTGNSKGALASVVLVGMLLGGLVWGALGDTLGRRVPLLLSVALNAIFGALSAVCPTWQSLAAMRFLAGVGVGGSVPVVFAQLAELLPQRQRGRFMVLLASHWMVGSLYSATVGWIVIPTAGWRSFLALASLPAWLCTLLVAALLPESPRHLLISGRATEALQVLRRAARVNGVKFPLDVTLRLPPGAGAQQQLLPCKYLPWHQRVAQQASQAADAMAALLRPPLDNITLPLLVAWVGLAGGWYATVLWVPQYFKLRCQQTGQCHETSIYADSFSVALANLPGNIASLYLVEAWGRRRTTTACLLGACLAALLFAAAPASGVWPLVAACTFNAISTGGWNCLDLLSTELYPTPVRSSGMGLLGSAGRVAAASATFLAGRLMEARPWLPLVMSAALLATGTAAMLLLPESAGRPLQDTVVACLSVPGPGALGTGGASRADGVGRPAGDARTVSMQEEDPGELAPMLQAEDGGSAVVVHKVMGQASPSWKGSTSSRGVDEGLHVA